MSAAIGAAGAILHYLKNGLRRQVEPHHAADAVSQVELHDPRRRDAGEPRTRRLARSARHEPARRARPHGHADGRRASCGTGFCIRCARSSRSCAAPADLIATCSAEAFLLEQMPRDAARRFATSSARSGGSASRAATRAICSRCAIRSRRFPRCRRTSALPSTAQLRADSGSGDRRATAIARPQTSASSLHEFPDPDCRLLAQRHRGRAAARVKEGGIFRDGYNAALDELRAASREGKDWIAALQQREIERTGHQVAQGPLQLRLRLFHRDHEVESRQRARATTSASRRPPTASASSRRS